MVINTMGWIDGLGFELIMHALAAFRVDVVLVIGQDRLYSQLSNHFRVRLPSSADADAAPSVLLLSALTFCSPRNAEVSAAF